MVKKEKWGEMSGRERQAPDIAALSLGAPLGD